MHSEQAAWGALHRLAGVLEMVMVGPRNPGSTTGGGNADENPPFGREDGNPHSAGPSTVFRQQGTLRPGGGRSPELWQLQLTTIFTLMYTPFQSIQGCASFRFVPPSSWNRSILLDRMRNYADCMMQAQETPVGDSLIAPWYDVYHCLIPLAERGGLNDRDVGAYIRRINAILAAHSINHRVPENA